MISPSKSEIFDALFHSKEEVRKRKKIRARKSYTFWRKQYRILKTYKLNRQSRIDLLYWLYNNLNSRHGFGTFSNSEWSKESLDLFLNDMKAGLIKY